MIKFLGVNKMPIPLEAIEDFKKTLWVDAYFKLERIEEGSTWKSKKITRRDFYVKTINPHIVVGRDGSSVLYPELMIQSGWWERNKWKYFGSDKSSKFRLEDYLT